MFVGLKPVLEEWGHFLNRKKNILCGVGGGGGGWGGRKQEVEWGGM